jgi:hypothetical protein
MTSLKSFQNLSEKILGLPKYTSAQIQSAIIRHFKLKISQSGDRKNVMKFDMGGLLRIRELQVQK